MKIAFMLRNLDEKGGIYIYTTNMIENILKADKETEYVFLYPKKKFLGLYSQYPNVKEIVLEVPSKFLWDQIAVPYILRKEKVDLVYNPKLSIPLFSKSKKVLMIHGAEQFAVKDSFKWHDRIYVRIAMPLYCKFADKIITTTQMGISDLSGYLRVDKSKFVFVHEGVNKRFQVLDQNTLLSVKKKYDLPDNYILFIGGLSPLKNFGRVVLAFDAISKTVPHKLVVVGFKRHKFKSDLILAEKLIGEDKIRFIGFLPDDDLPALYNMAELLIFPSLYEGFGLPVLEAMACGCPIVTSKAGCTREVTQDAAVLVDPYNVREIADSMIKVVTDRNLKRMLIEKGKKRVGQFCWEKCAAGTLEIFRSILN